MAIAISPLALWTDISGSIGSAISAAVWSNKLPKNLNKYLGLNATQIEDLYDSIVVARLAEPRDLVIEGFFTTVTIVLYFSVVAGTIDTFVTFSIQRHGVRPLPSGPCSLVPASCGGILYDQFFPRIHS